MQNWANLTKEQKDRHVSEYGCHEVHFFIKRRDPKYFNEVVRPVIQSKLEKSIVDKYLLDDHKSVVAYQDKNLDAFSKMNEFEKCLFIDSIVSLSLAKNDPSL